MNIEQEWNEVECQITPIRRRVAWKWIGYAASILVLLTIGWNLYFMPGEKNVLQDNTSIVAGTQKAILHLASGEKFVLSDSDGVIIEDSLSGRIEQMNKVLMYRTDSVAKKEQYNVLEVPNGGIFQVILSDGTRVWLNAGTRLTYPVNFVKGERRVSLEGEAYFEVKRDDAKPFVVEVKGMDVTVLGTSFNLKSFASDDRTIATLLSGKVEVKTSSRKVILMPNQQAELLVSKEQLGVREADLKSVMAWKNDMFIFKNATLECVMQEFSRWFDMEVEFEAEDLKALRVYIYIERSKTLKEVMDKVAIIDEIKWSIRGKKIVIEKQ
ncbi:FecR family protein [Butyricimonas synergistica]|uniref:FecR family protein n=1 Tax=Butyricimonas synergistica TaxID=544644 RepID=UPI00146D4604|nr:FecR domain-containing protein [Butyricimonas synergistica]